MFYRKKPVIIEAVQFNNSADIHEFCGDKVREPVGENYLEIETLEGVMKANKGDYIIKGVKGEFYPCKPDIFNDTYIGVYDKYEEALHNIINKRCLECGNSRTVTKGESFVYECGLSKKKKKDCLCEVVDHFRDM